MSSPGLLADYGWDAAWAAAFGAAAGPDWLPARVVTEHRFQYEVITAMGPAPAVLAGRYRHTHASLDWPAAGDFVAYSRRAHDGMTVVQAVLPRRTAFVRKTAGRTTEPQVAAANAQWVFLIVALTEPLNVRRLERYLAVTHQSGAQPVIVFTKADLRLPGGEHEPLARAVSPAPIHTVSAVTGEALETLRGYFGGGATVAVLGSSGAGKSTLVNALAGHERQATASVRDGDGRGRHTTRRRELIRLPTGGLILDTPGMREIHLYDAATGLAGTFHDIETEAIHCRFRDCSHTAEPGCAVRDAVARGALDAGRANHYLKLTAEAASMASERGAALRARERKQKERAISKAIKHMQRHRER